MIGQLIILQINELQNWQLGSALASILLISAIATCFAYDRIFGLSSVSTGGERETRADVSRAAEALPLCGSWASCSAVSRHLEAQHSRAGWRRLSLDLRLDADRPAARAIIAFVRWLLRRRRSCPFHRQA